MWNYVILKLNLAIYFSSTKKNLWLNKTNNNNNNNKIKENKIKLRGVHFYTVNSPKHQLPHLLHLLSILPDPSLPPLTQLTPKTLTLIKPLRERERKRTTAVQLTEYQNQSRVCRRKRIEAGIN